MQKGMAENLIPNCLKLTMEVMSMLNQRTNNKRGVRTLTIVFIVMMMFGFMFSIFSVVQAQDFNLGEDGPLNQRGDVISGTYGIVVDGIGLRNTPIATLAITVPGTRVEAAYLYWSGIRSRTDVGGIEDYTVTLQVDNNPYEVIADTVYGWSWWYDQYGHNTYVADVTDLVELGAHSYTFSDYEADRERYGFSLLIVYEDTNLPRTEITLLDGLDSVYHRFTAPKDSPSALNCIPVTADPSKNRIMDFTVIVGGAEIIELDPLRPNNLYYLTEISGTTVLTPGVDIRNMPGVNFFENPFTSAQGDEIDVYKNSIVVPAGDDVVCFQAESVNSLDPDGASFVWQVGAFSMRDVEPTAVNLQSLSADSSSTNLLALAVVGILLLTVATISVVTNRRRQK
jgi:hypothetical protein